MSGGFIALPMYDWPEIRAETDRQFRALAEALSRRGLAVSPDRLVRGADDLAGTGQGPGTSKSGAALDLHALWTHPDLLVAQTCWGPMSLGLADHVHVIGQPDYSGFPGCEGENYCSVIVIRKTDSAAPAAELPPPADGAACLSASLVKGRVLAFNSADSMSGLLGLTQDLAAQGEALDRLLAGRLESGGHRLSIRAVAEGRADLAAIDAKSWHLALAHEPAAAKVRIAGWTARRKGLPFITARHRSDETRSLMRSALAEAGLIR